MADIPTRRFPEVSTVAVIEIDEFWASWRALESEILDFKVAA